MPTGKTVVMPQARLREMLVYAEGRLYWVKSGKQAGCYKRKDGYGCLRLDNNLMLLHRVVWTYHNGPIPDGAFIDHIDGDRRNNTIENLRLASNSENLLNKGPRRDSGSGVKNVMWNAPTQSWRVKLVVDGKHRHFGLFATIEEAEAAARAAREQHHGVFANHTSRGGDHSCQA